MAESDVNFQMTHAVRWDSENAD